MKHNLSIPITYQHEIYSNELDQFDRVFLLLHGYSLDGEFMLKKLREHLPQNALILAPNGPFLVPVKDKNKDAFLPRYAWYFFDPYQKSFYINYEPAAHYLTSVLKHFNPQKKPVTIIGYSQGGYLAPKVAEVESCVDSVIGMACVFRRSKFSYRIGVQYHQIHGTNDSIVDYKGALKEFKSLKEEGGQQVGDFITLPNTGHRLQSPYIQSLKKIIQEKI